MIKRKFLSKVINTPSFMKMMGVFGLLLVFNVSMYGQCQQFQAWYSHSTCDDNGTENDSSDDSYTAIVNIGNGWNPNGTWSSDDGSFTNESYVTADGTGNFIFGPYPISGGDIGPINITDDQNPNCPAKIVNFIAPATCSFPTVTCPDFDLCYTLVSSGSCNASYLVSIEGDLVGYSNIHDLSFFFSISGGVIDEVSFFDDSGHLSNKGVVINGNTISGGDDMDGTNVAAPQFVIDVSTDIGNCVSLSNSVVTLGFGNQLCSDNEITTICDEPLLFCAEGVSVGGLVTGFSGEVVDCPETEGLGSEDVTVTITNANGEECSSMTGDDGGYDCSFCSSGPYTICIDTECEEPCDLSTIDVNDIVQIVLHPNGFSLWQKIMADVNKDGVVNLVDIIAVIRKTQGKDQDIVEDWCRFIPVSDYNAVENGNMAIEDLDDCITIDDASQHIDFIQFNLGDMNGSCDDCDHKDKDEKLEDELVTLDDNDNGKLKIILSKDVKFSYCTMQFNVPRGMEIDGVDSSLPGIEYVLQDDKLIVSVFSMDMVREEKKYKTSDGIIQINYISNGRSKMVLDDENNFIISKGFGVKRLVNKRRAIGKEGNNNQFVQINQFKSIHLPFETTNLDFRIVDMNGHIISIKKMKVHEGENFIRHDFSRLRNGLYFIHLSDPRNQIVQKIVISQ